VLIRDRPTIAARPAGGAAAAVAPLPAPARTPHTQPQPKPAPRTRPPLAVVPKSTRPHGRLGLLWVGVTVIVIVWSPVAVGIWLALCAGLAGIQTARVWRARNEKPMIPLAGAIAAVLPLCAIAGLREMTAAVAVAVVVTLLVRVFAQTKAPARDVGLTLAIGVVIGLAVASVVLLRNIGLHAPLLLLAFAAAYDAGAYLVGTGASSAWEGPAAGIATLIPVTMLSAVILVPPFPEGSPLLLGLVAAILAPCGPLAGSVLLGERDANAPALRRLDSLLVMAPIWAWIAAAFLR
ncbi:MAG: phosphatidate cytidylyltransferase, partial [Acidimicrobiales bacterium]